MVYRDRPARTELQSQNNKRLKKHLSGLWIEMDKSFSDDVKVHDV